MFNLREKNKNLKISFKVKRVSKGRIDKNPINLGITKGNKVCQTI